MKKSKEELNLFRYKLIKYYIEVEEWKQSDIARLLNLSRQRVHQILNEKDKRFDKDIVK